MATFDGVSFDEAGRQGKFNPRAGGQTRHAVHKIPGGSSYFLQVIGKIPVEFDLPIQAGSAAIDSLVTKAQSGTSATLTYSGGAPTARLVAIENYVEVVANGTVFQANAKFVI